MNIYIFMDHYEHDGSYYDMPYCCLSDTLEHAIDIFCKEKGIEYVGTEKNWCDSTQIDYVFKVKSGNYFEGHSEFTTEDYSIFWEENIKPDKLYGG